METVKIKTINYNSELNQTSYFFERISDEEVIGSQTNTLGGHATPTDVLNDMRSKTDAHIEVMLDTPVDGVAEVTEPETV